MKEKHEKILKCLEILGIEPKFNSENFTESMKSEYTRLLEQNELNKALDYIVCLNGVI